MAFSPRSDRLLTHDASLTKLLQFQFANKIIARSVERGVFYTTNLHRATLRA